MLFSAGSVMMMPMAVTNMTALAGILVFGLTLASQAEPGIAPSRLNAKVIREALVRHAVVQNSWPAVEISSTRKCQPSGSVDVIFGQALPEGWHFLVLLISTAGQLFCTTACLTSASRMTFAFSRDGAIPGSSWLSKVHPSTRIPTNAVIFVSIIGVAITLPALKSVGGVPVAFLAVVSVAVIGLYLAFAVPIFLRWRMGDAFEPGSWTNGSKYRWMNLVAVAEIGVISIYFIMPFTPAGIPGNKDFTWSSVNYAPVLTFGTLIVLAIWWNLSAKKWFTGPKHTIDEDVIKAFDD